MTDKKKPAPEPAKPFTPFVPPREAGEWILTPAGPVKVEPPKPEGKE